MIVIDILSTIDPEAIRAEARAEALREAKGKLAASERLLTTRYRSDYEEGFGDALSEAQDIILADEPKEREGRDGGLRWHCKHCASEFNDSFMEYYCDDDAGEGDYVGECPVCGSRNLITACSHIKEAKE